MYYKECDTVIHLKGKLINKIDALAMIEQIKKKIGEKYKD